MWNTGSAGIKIFQIVSAVFRNIKKGFDDLVMEVACGLFNFRYPDMPRILQDFRVFPHTIPTEFLAGF